MYVYWKAGLHHITLQKNIGSLRDPVWQDVRFHWSRIRGDAQQLSVLLALPGLACFCCLSLRPLCSGLSSRPAWLGYGVGSRVLPGRGCERETPSVEVAVFICLYRYFLTIYTTCVYLLHRLGRKIETLRGGALSYPYQKKKIKIKNKNTLHYVSHPVI